jgi:acetyltransferase-like isoleucine patch superfamily enzyme
MINFIREIVFFIFRKLIPPGWIDQAIKTERIKQSVQGCVYGKHTNILQDARIINFQGNKNNIQIGDFCTIRGELQINEYGGKISIGEYSYIGEYSRVWSGDTVIIGNRVQISHNVNIIDNNTHSLNSDERHYEYVEIIEKGNIKKQGNIAAAPIVIEDDVWISFNACILKGVTIGKGAIIAANSVVTKNVEPYTMVAGNPAVVIKSIEFE